MTRSNVFRWPNKNNNNNMNISMIPILYISIKMTTDLYFRVINFPYYYSPENKLLQNTKWNLKIQFVLSNIPFKNLCNFSI